MSQLSNSQDEMKRLLQLMESVTEADYEDDEYLDDEESDEEFKSGDLVRFTDDYAEPDFPDEVYTLKDWDPVKGRGWAVDEDGQGWSVQSFQIQHAYVDEAAPLAVAAGGAVARKLAQKGAGKMVSKSAGSATTRAADSGIKSASKWAKDKLNQMAADPEELEEISDELKKRYIKRAKQDMDDLDDNKDHLQRLEKDAWHRGDHDEEEEWNKLRAQQRYKSNKRSHGIYRAKKRLDKTSESVVSEGGCGCDAPEVPAQTDTSINYSKTHTQDDASVTVSANARDLQQLQDMLRLAGVDADISSAQVVEPEVVAEPEPAVSFGTRGDYSYSTDADFIRDQLMQRMKGFM